MSTSTATLLDCRGLACPLPVVETARVMRSLEPGDLLEVLATDPAAQYDVPSWCHATGNDLVTWSRTGGVFTYVIRKR